MNPEQLRLVGELRALAASGKARALRETRRIGLRELARVIGASPSAVSRWENGVNRPRAAIALKWATVLGLEPGAEAPAGNDDSAGVQPAPSVERIKSISLQAERTRS
jgi:transcriptional regulator with XRE-family HTH domain